MAGSQAGDSRQLTVAIPPLPQESWRANIPRQRIEKGRGPLIGTRLLSALLLASGVCGTAITAVASFIAHVPQDHGEPALMLFGFAAAAIDILGGSILGFLAAVLFRMGRPLSGTVLGTFSLSCMAYSALHFYAMVSASAQQTSPSAVYVWVSNDLASELTPERLRELHLLALAALLTVLKVMCLALGTWLWPRSRRPMTYEIVRTVVCANAPPATNTAQKSKPDRSADARLHTVGVPAAPPMEALLEPSRYSASLSIDVVSFTNVPSPLWVDSTTVPADKNDEVAPPSSVAPEAARPQWSTVSDENTMVVVSLLSSARRHDRHYRSARGPPSRRFSAWQARTC